jgi:DNA-binding NtrC family response regulator
MAKSDWPGNVRELENYVERLLVVCDGPVLEPRVLPGDLEEASSRVTRPALAGLHGFGAANLAEALATLERELILDALRRANGNRSRAARSLGLAEPTLRYRIRRLGLVGGEEVAD